MEYKYFTLGREPKVGENIMVNGRNANVRFVNNERILIGKSLILRQPELAMDYDLLAVKVGFEFID